MKTILVDSSRSHPFFHGMVPHHLAVLSEGATEVRWMPGETLFNEGEPTNRFFLLQEGRIVLEAHEPGDGVAVVKLLGPGEVLGWSWLFPPFTWRLRARALEHSSAIVLDAGHLLGAAEENHDFGYELNEAHLAGCESTVASNTTSIVRNSNGGSSEKLKCGEPRL